MGFANKMTNLLNKVEKTLGLKQLNLPDAIKKESWAEEVIIPLTLVTFSRFYPHKLTYFLNDENRGTGGFYYLDEDMFPGNVEIIGVKDIAFDQFAGDSTGSNAANPYGIYDSLSGSFSVEDFAYGKMRQDMYSMYNTGTFVEFERPNKIAIKNASGSNMVGNIKNYPIYIFVTHSDNLATIEPTKMETFENLAIADVAQWLYGELKYFDGLETIFAGNIDLKLDDLKTYSDKREDIIEFLRNNYVSADNINQPSILCI